MYTSPVMRLSRGDDLTSPTVRISSLKHQLLSSFSSCPHCFSCIFFIHIPASFAIIPRPLPVFFSFSFFVPVTPFLHHSYCPPATPLILTSWENRKRGQGSAVAPQDAAATSFSLDLIWGIHSLAIACFPSSLATSCFSAHVPGKI